MKQNFNPDAGGEMDDQNIAVQPCAEWQPLLTLFAAGEELAPAEFSRLTAHLASCASCSASLAEEKEILALLAANRIEPDAALFASCRAGLEDALDRQEDRGWLRRVFGARFPSSWLVPGPVWSAAVLLVIGFSVGVLAPRMLRHPAPSGASDKSPANFAFPNSSNPGAPADFVPTKIDLHSADVAGISVVPSGDEGPAHVELQLKAQQPVTVQGTVDDDDVKTVLLDILGKGDRVCPDIRLDAVECLRSRNNDPDVRSALCRAVHTTTTRRSG